VGETALQRKKGEANKTVRAQVQAAIADLKGDGRAPCIIAYEPVWAIGSGRPCSPQDARDMHGVIRGALEKKFGHLAENIRVIYGGSVDARNISEYMTTTGVEGALVGGASLDPRNFGLLCRAAVPA
jgi:triosephosphate isomerase